MMAMSGEAPHANTLYHVKDIHRGLKKKDSVVPIGIVIHPPEYRHSGHYFLAKFTKAPRPWLETFPGAEREWFLMQTAHELGHANGGDEVMADACGALAFVELTGEYDFLMQWYKARICKWLFKPESHDLACAKVVESIHDRFKSGWKPGHTMASRELLLLAKDIKERTPVDHRAHADFKESFLPELNRGMPIEIFIEKHSNNFDNMEAVVTLKRCCITEKANPFRGPIRHRRCGAASTVRFSYGG
jgi:hypothetical protein